MRIAVDAMGGDNAPAVPVAAAVAATGAVRDPDLKVLLVGPKEQLDPLLGEEGHRAIAGGRLELVQASEVIGPDEPPVAALRLKRDATINVGLLLVREKVSDALVSAGSTGALMAGAFRQLGRVRGVPRPALATVFPSLGPGGREFLFLDLGANADARPEHLRVYAVMGALYAEKVLGRAHPRVALLNNGTEPGKGSELAKEAHRLMSETPGLSFVGNIEGRDIFSGSVDVVVTDGFTGNVVVKTIEGIVQGLFGVMKEEFTRGLRSKVGALLLKSSFRSVKRRLDYSEYGGAPFLGVNGAVIKCHGSSNTRALVSGIGVAERFVSGRVIELISRQLQALNRAEEGTEEGSGE